MTMTEPLRPFRHGLCDFFGAGHYGEIPMRCHGLGRSATIALTAYASAEDRTRAMRAGFQDHVKKPVDARELLAVIAALTASAGRR